MQKHRHTHTGEHSDRHNERLEFFPFEFLTESLKNNDNHHRGDKNGNGHNACAHSDRSKLSVFLDCRSLSGNGISDKCGNKTDKCGGGDYIAEFVVAAGIIRHHSDLALYLFQKNRDKNKIKGRQRLTAMLKSGKELKVFTISEEHLKQFATEAKRYGVVYCALRGKEKSADGMVDVMVRAEDASKINRIVERFHLATVDTASIKHEIEKTRAEKGAGEKMEAPAVPEKGQPEKSDEDKLLDEMLGAPTRKEEPAPVNPSAARTEKSPPSAPTSEPPSKTAEGAAKSAEQRPSVRKELRDIQAQRRQEEAAAPVKEPERTKKPAAKANQHKQPPRKKKKAKER